MRLMQVNLQKGFGGGEIYTCFLGRALRELGQPFDLIVHRNATWWREYDTGATRIHAVSGFEEIASLPFQRPAWLVYHTPDGGERLSILKSQGCRLASFVHLPTYQRRIGHLRDYDLLVAVSGYVLSGLRENGLNNVHGEPLYGIAHLDRGSAHTGPLMATSRFSWDTRKLRDRALGWIYPIWQGVRPSRAYSRRKGLTLGVVSRITPIKQFPALFRLLAPVLARHADVTVDIFGSGGYASIRDTAQALAPMNGRVRWWGEQRDVRQVYGVLDYLLTGLPEKEALGLNVIEAQMCGTPVLAPDAPPFRETIEHGRTGYLYPDPRSDGASGFATLIDGLLSGTYARPDPLLAKAHLARFEGPAFQERVAHLLAAFRAAS